MSIPTRPCGTKVPRDAIHVVFTWVAWLVAGKPVISVGTRGRRAGLQVWAGGTVSSFVELIARQRGMIPSPLAFAAQVHYFLMKTSQPALAPAAPVSPRENPTLHQMSHPQQVAQDASEFMEIKQDFTSCRGNYRFTSCCRQLLCRDQNRVINDRGILFNQWNEQGFGRCFCQVTLSV